MRTTTTLLLCAALLATPDSGNAFSVLAHQGVVDATWQDAIVPALRRRFPAATAQDLERAHAYAYGGCHIADLGYFPFGNRLFTDLAHYVRSGDLVSALLRDATTLDELAFALGALSHWHADVTGHAEATNPAVAEIYPALRERYGDWVTYDEDHGAHLDTEFRFDVFQLTRARQSPDLFKHAIEFAVAEPLLDRAFRETYGLGLSDLFASTDVAITTYRWGFREVVQEATGVAWQLYEPEIKVTDPSATAETFVGHMSRADFEKQFGSSYREAGWVAKFFALFTGLVPDVGPFERLPFKPLPPHVRQEFTEAFGHVVTFYRSDVQALGHDEPRLPNLTLDTGAPTLRGEYPPADRAYAALLGKLAERNFAGISAATRADILRFYAGGDSPATETAGFDDETRAALERLRGGGPA
jgi:zinc dependent phospholipase C